MQTFPSLPLFSRTCLLSFHLPTLAEKGACQCQPDIFLMQFKHHVELIIDFLQVARLHLGW